MKLTRLLGSAVLAAALSTSAFAEEKTYVAVNLGSGIGGTGVSASYGSTAGDIYPNLGWEVDGYYMLGNETDSTIISIKEYGYGINAYAMYTYPVMKGLTAAVGFGLGYNVVGLETTTTIPETMWTDASTTTIDGSSTSFIAYKVQVKYEVTDTIKATAGYNMYMSTIGVEMAF